VGVGGAVNQGCDQLVTLHTRFFSLYLIPGPAFFLSDLLLISLSLYLCSMQKVVVETFSGYSASTIALRLARPRPDLTADPELLRFLKGENRLIPFLPPDSGFAPGEVLTPARLHELRTLLSKDEWAALLIYYPLEVVNQIWKTPPSALRKQVRFVLSKSCFRV
jgi:hypothetical protein